MVDSVDPEQAAAAARFRQLWSAYEENRDLMLMGAYVAGSEPVLDEAIRSHPDQLAFVTQSAGAQVDFQSSRQSLIEGYSARSDQRRVGKECVSSCRSRWSPYN